MACEFEGPSYCHLKVKSKAYCSVSTVMSLYKVEPEVGGIFFYGF